MLIHNNKSLRNFNTFNIEEESKYFASFSSEKELLELLNTKIAKSEPLFILGGGSNILLSKKFEGLTLANQIKGITIFNEDTDSKFIRVGAGENWHDFVIWSISKNLSGIENLALIPGSVGASPMQNIGAYGAEVRDVIESVEYLQRGSKKIISLENEKCLFDYRDSIFKKQLKNKIIITHVNFRLSKSPLNNINYSALSEELEKTKKTPSIKNIAEAVINIRTRKLPNPKLLGNSGSFFKNPIISTTQFLQLKKKFPKIKGYLTNNKKEMKIAAGWLIENAGLKGYRKVNVGTHEKQALVLINYGSATGKEILNLAEEIELIIKEKYNIQLEKEVNII